MTNEQQKRYSEALKHAHVLPLLDSVEAKQERAKMCIKALRVALLNRPALRVHGRVI